ncbi:uncharacterized protein [Littorina saxatilis]|uniref:Nischarin C-terminal PH domain-containing protein n=1 Tax=Littorina saxatilis TaxID=31220 RepID=A0AAN9BFH9_9CAEN
MPDLKHTRHRSAAGIFIPGRSSPSQLSVSSCTSAQELEGADVPSPIPEAHPFDPSSEARPAAPTARREYSAADLPTMASLDFVSWLEDRLLGEDASPNHPPPAPSLDDPGGTAASPNTDQVMDVMWCYAQQYSNPAVIFPCCAVLTTTKVIVERLSGLAEESTFPGIPELRPCVILPLGSIQHLVVGPCHAYLRLEEAFVGKGGLFTLFAVEKSALTHFADTLKDCCMQLDVTSPLDVLDLSHQSDLLTEVCRREEICGLPSDRLAFVELVKMKERGEVKSCLLVLSENLVYCLDLACVYWPPATFESAHEGTIHLKVLREFSIMEHIADLALHAADHSDNSSSGQGKVDFTPTSITMQVKSVVSENSQRELVLLFSLCSSRDTFLDRLTNLRAEHAHRMSPSVREAPEGGNESQDVADSSLQTCESERLSAAPAVVYNGVEQSQKHSRPVPPKVSITQYPGTSLPSSFDWKGYYFNTTGPINTSHSAHDFSSLSREGGREGDAKTEVVVRVEAEVNNKDYLTDIQSSGEVEEAAPTPFEMEMREAVRTYDLLHPMPARLRPISLMSGREVVAFFCSKIAGSLSSCSSPSELSKKVAATCLGSEELRHVMWTMVVPYTDPTKEVVTLVMLSTRAVYLVSDSSTVTSAPNARPSWMTHNRHKSDSAVSWHSKSPSSRGSGSGRGSQWSKVKAYAVLVLGDLLQVSMGLFDQFLRLTGPDAHTVHTLATRDSRLTAGFVEKLKTSLTLMVSSPSPHGDKTQQDIEQDFYHAFAKRTNSTVEGLVYTHPSQVTFLYPGDDAIDDILFLIKAKVQAAATQVESSTPGKLPAAAEQKEAMWLYILAYQLLPPFTESIGAVPPERIQQRSVIVTSHHLCLVLEDVVTYPLPDFVRGLPEQPQHDVLETRRLESLKRILLSPSNPHVLCLVFWDEPEELVVDTNMQHFGGAAGIGGTKGGREVVPEVVIKLYVHSQRDKDKLVQTLQKQWRELVPQVGRILDVVRE